MVNRDASQQKKNLLNRLQTNDPANSDNRIQTEETAVANSGLLQEEASAQDQPPASALDAARERKKHEADGKKWIVPEDTSDTEPSRNSPVNFLWIAVVCVLAIIVAGIVFFRNPESHVTYTFIGPLPATVSADMGQTGRIPEPSRRCSVVSVEESPALDIDARAYLAIDVTSFKVLYEKNMDERVPFASIVKLLGSLVALDEFELDAKMGLLHEVDAQENGIDLEVGEMVGFEDLLGAALVGSKNDAIYAITQNYPGGTAGFVDAMQKRAEEIGLDNTSVVNVIGLDDPHQYSTPRDIAVLLIVAMRNPEIARLVSMSSYTVHTDRGRDESIWSTNSLLGQVDGVIGGKTGFTSEAGWSMATYVEDRPDFVTVVMNADDRYEATKDLINLVRGTYECM